MRHVQAGLRPQHIVVCLLTLFTATLSVSADIYEWEYIDPLQPELGKQESTTLVPDGAGVDAVPGADLSGKDLTKAYLIGADLAGVDFLFSQLDDVDITDAVINNASLLRATEFGFTEQQLASTASYKALDLSGIGLEGNDLSGWDLTWQNLIDSSLFRSHLFGTDTRGAQIEGIIIGGFGNRRNYIQPDGGIHDGLLLSGMEQLSIRDDDGGPTLTPIPITVQTAFDIDPTATLRFIFEDPDWGSTILFDVSVGTANLGGTLELTMKLDDGLTPADLLGATFKLFDWTGVSIVGGFDAFVLDPAWFAAGLSIDRSLLITTGEVRVVPLIGDLNGDGFVGVDDLNLLLVRWNQNVLPGDLLSGDITGDGFIGVDDLNVLLGTWNAGSPPPADVLALVPEPSAAAVLVLGGLAALWRRSSPWTSPPAWTATQATPPRPPSAPTSPSPSSHPSSASLTPPPSSTSAKLWSPTSAPRRSCLPR